MTTRSKPIETLLSDFESPTQRAANGVFRPTLIDADTGYDELEALLESGSVRTYRDCYLDQLRELGVIRHAAWENFSAECADTWVDEQLGSATPSSQGVYVYYPWSGALVHLVTEAEFCELRTNRNRYKITPKEQDRLRRCTIGIVGLSVGHTAATTLALEGIGGHFRLADYDRLDLSNLNRIRSRLEMLGLNKAVIAARELYELNPFLEIEVFSDGIDAENFEAFLEGRPKLDLLVEECDDFFAKLKLREHARDLRIPVVMDTSDRGMLDVERFDQEPTRPVFHGLLQDLTAEDVRGLTTKEKIPYVLRALGEDTLSSRLAASMLEVKQSIYTWPQLGSAVTLGGALVAHGARRVLLDQVMNSGRYYVDLDRAIGHVPEDLLHEKSSSTSSGVPAFNFDPSVPRDADRRQQLRWMVAAAHLAPSAGNQQPWRFVACKSGRLLLGRDRDRKWTFLDYRGLATEVALGAATENLAIAATHLGLCAKVDTPGSDGTREIIFFSADPSVTPDPLLDAIPKRATERRHDRQPNLPSDAIERIVAAGDGPAGRFVICSQRGTVERVADLVAAADRFTYLHPVTHRELMGELRWSDAEASRRRDGIRISELELTPFDESGLRLAKSPEAVRLVRKFGGGEGVGKLSRSWIRGSAAVGLYAANERTKQGAFSAGRAIQRAWLTASLIGVGLHPLTGLLYLGMRAEDSGEGLTGEERAELTRLLAQVREAFGLQAQQAPLFLFRLVPVAAKRQHLRLELDDVFSSE